MDPGADDPAAACGNETLQAQIQPAGQGSFLRERCLTDMQVVWLRRRVAMFDPSPNFRLTIAALFLILALVLAVTG